MQKVYIQRFASFIPTEAMPKPDVAFVPMLTRRRLSALSRMVVYTSDKISKDDNGNKLAPCKVTFASQYGEITQQLKIAEVLIDTGKVSPSHFSSSVFNTPVANATILEKNMAGYSAVYGGKNAFIDGLADCLAAMEIESAEDRSFIFADELIPETYAPIAGVPYPNAVCAVALRLTKDETKADKCYKDFDLNLALQNLKFLQTNFNTASDQALAFIMSVQNI